MALNDNLSLKFINKLIDFGVADFYCGFVPSEWYNNFGWEVSLNRRENDRIYHFVDYKKLLFYKSYLKKLNKKLFLALNSHHYSSKELLLLEKIIKKLARLNFNDFIISDLNVFRLLKENIKNPTIRASIGTLNNNFESLKFYQSLGFKQFILPRQLTIPEIKEFLKYGQINNLTFEIFFISYKCPFSDEICYSCHGYNLENFCQHLLNSQGDLVFGNKKIKLINYYDFYNKKNKSSFCYKVLKDNIRYCGLCFLKEFAEYNNVLFKIPVRGDESNLQLIIDLIKFATQDSMEFTGFCRDKINCYYG